MINFGKMFANKENNSKQRIIHMEAMVRSNEKALVEFYHELVPGDNSGTINIPKIVSGFDCYMESIGERNFLQVLKHFGYGVKNSKKCPNINELMGGIRTVKNAMYYLDSFEELVKDMASMVEGAPKGMDELTKMKVFRMYLNIFSGAQFFKEEFFNMPGTAYPVMNTSIFSDLNKIGMNPEQILLLFKYAQTEKGKNVIPLDGKVRYSGIMYQLNRLDKKTRKEVLQVCELEEKDGAICSVNKCIPNLTFQNVRSLKCRIFPKLPYTCFDTFVYEHYYKDIRFTDAFNIMWAGDVRTVKNCPVEKREMNYSENGSKLTQKMLEYYRPFDDSQFAFGGQWEADMYLELFEYMASEDIMLKGQGINLETGMETQHDFSVRMYWGALNYLLERGKLNHKSDIEKTAKEVESLVLNPSYEKALKLYASGNMSTEEMAEIVETVKLPEFLSKASPEVLEFVKTTFQKELDDFSDGKLDEEEFKKAIGFKNEFTYMLNIDTVDGQAIEGVLSDFKKIPDRTKSAKEMRKAKFAVLFYCFLVERGIKCGANHKPLKRNKAFKIEILKKIVA